MSGPILRSLVHVWGSPQCKRVSSLRGAGMAACQLCAAPCRGGLPELPAQRGAPPEGEGADQDDRERCSRHGVPGEQTLHPQVGWGGQRGPGRAGAGGPPLLLGTAGCRADSSEPPQGPGCPQLPGDREERPENQRLRDVAGGGGWDLRLHGRHEADPCEVDCPRGTELRYGQHRARPGTYTAFGEGKGEAVPGDPGVRGALPGTPCVVLGWEAGRAGHPVGRW